MQTLSPYPRSWQDLIQLLIGVFIGLIPELIRTYRNRKKSDLENEEAEARTDLARAETTSLHIRDGIATGEGVSKMLGTLIEASETIKEQQARIFELEQGLLELRIARYDVRRMKGLLDAHSIPYSEADVTSKKSRG